MGLFKQKRLSKEVLRAIKPESRWKLWARALFKPAWMNENQEKALKAVKKIKNQNKLAQIAQRDYEGVSEDIMAAAAESLTDQDLMAETARSNKTPHDSAIALVDRLTDQALLAGVAQSPYSHASVRAVERLDDQALLAEVAKNAGIGGTSLGALVAVMEKLTDQILLADLAKTAESPALGCMAVEKLTDENLLADVKKNAGEPATRIAASSKLEGNPFPSAIESARKTINKHRQKRNKNIAPGAKATEQ